VDKSFEIASVAAKWWANLLKSNFSHDNGGSIMQSAMMNYISSLNEKLSNESISAFESTLAKLIHADIETMNYVLDISVDYDACDILVSAFAIAGISYEKYLLPCKTQMIISPDKIIAKIGYGSPFETIYDADISGVE
jgi:hypothetical protein